MSDEKPFIATVSLNDLLVVPGDSHGGGFTKLQYAVFACRKKNDPRGVMLGCTASEEDAKIMATFMGAKYTGWVISVVGLGVEVGVQHPLNITLLTAPTGALKIPGLSDEPGSDKK